jgi:hypothetical protein
MFAGSSTRDIKANQQAKVKPTEFFSVVLLPTLGQLVHHETGNARHGRLWFQHAIYRVVMRVLAVLLAFFGFLLFREGWKQLG